MIEQMFITKKAPYPVERTLLVTGALDALMTSHAEGERYVLPCNITHTENETTMHL
jgi:hypothetical protein